MLRKKPIVTVCGALLFAVSGYAQDTPIRPFKVNVSEESLADFRRRIAATRWPEKETVADQSQGMQLAKLGTGPPMIETYPLEKAADAYARMLSGDAQFRVVLTM